MDVLTEWVAARELLGWMMHIAVTPVCLLGGLDDVYRCYACLSVCLMVWMMHIAVTPVCLSVCLMVWMMCIAVTPVCLSA